MSLALHLAADALADLRRLDPWLQEETLDELDRLAADPSLILAPLPGWGIVHAIARANGGLLHVVTFVLERNDARGVLTLLGVRALPVT